MAGVRPFVEADVPVVSDLVWRILHERPGSSPASLKTYFSELFLHNPWMDDGIVSRVYEDSQSKIVGFFGALPRRMTIQGQTVRLAFGSNFVMDPESRASMAALQLVKAFMKGSQDISITDSANENSRKLLRSLGFSVVPIYSLLWARPLRPAQYALHGIARLKKSRLLHTASALAQPFSGLADRISTSIEVSPLRQVPPSTTLVELTAETLLDCFAKIPGKQLLLPEYNLASLKWALEFVCQRKTFGNVRKMLVRQGEKNIGWFIYYVAPGGVGDVLQIGGDSNSISSVLDHLFYDAWQQGLIGLHGRMEPQFMQELTQKACIFLRNGSWTLAHSPKPELLGLFHSGTAFFSRMDGEWAYRPEPVLPL